MNFLKHHKKTETQIDESQKTTRWLACLIVISFALLPMRLFPQAFNPLISFSVESCTLDAALEKLFDEYELNVAFSKAEMSKIRIERYSCSYKSVEEVLTDLLRGTDYGFKKVGKQYVIKRNHLLEPASEEAAENKVNAPPETHKEIVQHKTDTIVSPRLDTVRIIDTMMVIRTVMRRDTVVHVEKVVETDTVYKTRYRGLEIKWPEFKDNGWFVSPSVAYGFAGYQYQTSDSTLIVSPSSDVTVGLAGGHKSERFSIGMSLSYRTLRYRFALERVVREGDYYVNDTLDVYYVVHPGSADTTYHYILDSTYVPMVTTQYDYRDVNRLDYLNVGLFASFDLVKRAHFRAFAKAGVSADFLLSQAGSISRDKMPYLSEITREMVEPVRFSYHAGLGVAFKIVKQLELVPEVEYSSTPGALYLPDFPFDLRVHSWNAKLGLTYYF